MSYSLDEDLSKTNIPDITLEKLKETHVPITLGDIFCYSGENYEWLNKQSISRKVYFVINDTVLKVYISNVRDYKMYIDFSDKDYDNVRQVRQYPYRMGTEEFPLYRGYKRIMWSHGLVDKIGKFYIPK